MIFKTRDIVNLIADYGENATLKEVHAKIADGRLYRCPKCKGDGIVVIEYNGYPSGLPDSGFVYEPAFRNEECDLCQGHGFTKEQYQPRMIQDGWEIVK